MVTIKKEVFDKNQKAYLTKFKCLPQHVDILRAAKKNGGLKKDGKHYFEVFDYFDASNFPPTGDSCGGHIDFTEGIVLEKLDQCTIVTNTKISSNSDQFTFQIYQDDSLPVDLYIDTGFPLLCNLSEMWQHFMQDALHFLFFSQEFLKANPSIPILLYGPNDAAIIDVIKNVLCLKNPLIRLPPSPVPGRIIKFDSLIFCRFLPKSHLYSCAPEMRRRINASLSDESVLKNRLVYFSRKNQSTRTVSNELELVENLKNHCERENLIFTYWESDRFSLAETIELMKSAKTVVAPHGGANYHCYWMSPGTKLIEFVFPDLMETLMPIACSIGLDYWLLPIEGTNHFSKNFNADIESLNSILGVKPEIKEIPLRKNNYFDWSQKPF